MKLALSIMAGSTLSRLGPTSSLTTCSRRASLRGDASKKSSLLRGKEGAFCIHNCC